jgi:Cu+-exporting ATPase
MLGRSDHREPESQGRQVIHIEVDGGYRPAVVHARPGSAIRLVFHRIDDDDCTERVIFSTPRLERRLTAYDSTPVDLLAQEEGEIRFTCGMGRYSGVIRLEEPSSSWLGALRRRLDHIRGAL